MESLIPTKAPDPPDPVSSPLRSLRANLSSFQPIQRPGIAVGAFEGLDDEGAFHFDGAGGVRGGGVGFELDVGEVIGLTARAEFALGVFKEDKLLDAALPRLSAMHVADNRDPFSFEVLHAVVDHEGPENDVGLHAKVDVFPSDFFSVAGLRDGAVSGGTLGRWGRGGFGRGR